MSIYLPFFETAWIVFQEQLPLFPSIADRLIHLGDHVAAKDHPDETLGVITSIEDDEAFIQMPRWMVERDYKQLMYEREGWEEISSLVHVEGYSIQELAGAVYGQYGFHSLYDVKRSYFDAWRYTGIRCQYQHHDEWQCRETAVGVGLINFLGTVMPFAMCLEHTEWHGMCCEHVPFTRKVHQAEHV